MTMAAAPLPLETRGHVVGYHVDDSDLDAEGDEVLDDEQIASDDIGEDQDEDAEGSDAEAEADSDEDDGDDVPAAGPSRIRKRVQKADSDVDMMDEASNVDDSSDADEEDSDNESSDEESIVAEPWNGGSEGADGASVQLETRNNCV